MLSTTMQQQKYTDKIKVLVYPKDANPYQELLYSNTTNCEIKYIPQPTVSHILNMLLLPILLVRFRLNGFSVLHLHWLYNFRFPIKKLDNTITQTLTTMCFCLLLLEIKLLRYKLVWTVHNVIPHEKTFVFQDHILKLLAWACDLKIVHSKQTLNIMKLLKLDVKRTKVIPIGTYTNVYDNSVSKEDARKHLDLENSEFVIMFFGMIKPYKGIVKLLDVFSRMLLPNTKLLIVGQCDDAELKNKIMKYKSIKNIRIHFGYVSDNDVQLYFNACDVVVLPFEEITTSSTVLLAFSFYRTVIAPYIGAIADIPQNLGFFYCKENCKEGSLEDAMLDAYKNKDKVSSMGNEAHKYVKNFSWKAIGEKTEQAYKEL